MNILRTTLGAGIGLVLMAVAMKTLGVEPSAVLQKASATIVFGVTIGFLIMAYPLKVQIKSFRIALFGLACTRAESLVARNYFLGMGYGAIVSGAIGTIVGLTQVMENLNNPALIGPGMAVAFVSILYGFALFVFIASPLADTVAMLSAERWPND